MTPMVRSAAELSRLTVELMAADADTWRPIADQWAEVATDLVTGEPETTSDALALAWYARAILTDTLPWQGGYVPPERTAAVLEAMGALERALEHLSGQSATMFDPMSIGSAKH